MTDSHMKQIHDNHKAFIWKSPNAIVILLHYEWGLSQQAFWREEQIHRTWSQPSSVFGHPARIAYLSGFQIGFGDNCSGQAALGLWLQADGWARAVASHLGWSRRGYRHRLKPRDLAESCQLQTKTEALFYNLSNLKEHVNIFKLINKDLFYFFLLTDIIFLHAFQRRMKLF